MIVRLARALIVGLLAMVGSWLTLVPAVGASATSASVLSVAPSRSSQGHPFGAPGRSDLPVRQGRAHQPRAHAAIVGGAPISIGQAPWQVAIEAEPSGDEQLFCGGSIIDDSHILTAAHCVFDPETGEVIPPGDFIVRAGTFDLASSAGGEEQERGVTDVRPHPYYLYAPESGRVNPDDVAILTLERPLALGSDVTPIAIVTESSSLPEGTAVNLTGFGQQDAVEPPNGKLYTLGMTLGYARECGGENDAVLLCASGSTGTACDGDSGGALTLGLSSTLVGVVDDYFLVSGQKCSPGAENAFTNVAAPEIQDFIDGSEAPPRAPRGGGVVIFERPINDGVLGCGPGHWSENPTFIYTFIDTDGQVLQQGASSTYAVPAAEVGHKVLCQVQASNAGGSGIGRTPGLLATVAAPPPPVEGTTTTSTSATSLKATSGQVSLLRTLITVQSSGTAGVALACKGTGPCSGKLIVTSMAGKGHASAAKTGRSKRPGPTTIGIATFSIAMGKTATVLVRLSAPGRALLKTDHGRLNATLTIVESLTASMSTRHESVRLVSQKSHRARA